MGLYDAFKDVLTIAQKADNIEIYRQLLDLSSQVLELQAENSQLKEKLTQINQEKVNEGRLLRHFHPYITLSDDKQNLKYCSVCWGRDHKLIQMIETPDSSRCGSSLYCYNCNNGFYVDMSCET